MKKNETDEFATIPEGKLVVSSRSYGDWYYFAKDMEKQRNRLQARLDNALKQRDDWALKYAKLKNSMAQTLPNTPSQLNKSSAPYLK